MSSEFLDWFVHNPLGITITDLCRNNCVCLCVEMSDTEQKTQNNDYPVCSLNSAKQRVCVDDAANIFTFELTDKNCPQTWVSNGPPDISK